jgi:hypothetical protein
LDLESGRLVCRDDAQSLTVTVYVMETGWNAVLMRNTKYL